MTKKESYGLGNLHNELLDLMCFIHSFCETNGIKYSLTGGSLLGAIRHNGFIPWDDDFDIMFDRCNYEKFIIAMSNATDLEYILEQDQWVYRVRKCHKINGYVPSIDLFVMDRVPNSKIVNKIQIIRLMVLQGMLRENSMYREYSWFYSFCIKVTAFLGHFFNKKNLFSRYDKVSQIGNKKGSKHLSIFNDKFKLISYQYKDNIMDGYELHKFENKEFFIITRYEDYLKKQFGDYMQLPPEKERAPQHIY
ncbi:MAG: LicD family protein [Salinivirgaceae bacterium]|nr:LicD family protein [Salinivirgaceae bacterium]